MATEGLGQISGPVGIKQVVTGSEFATALDQLQRSQPAERVVEPATIRFIASLGRHFLFVQRIGISLRDRLQDQPLRFPQPVAPVINETGSRG